MPERVLPIHGDDRVVVLGAGPCGLACARELERLGHRNWTVLERSDRAGGLASSVVDSTGFTWDLGGHVVFSHFGEFDRLLYEMLGEEVLHHERSSFVRVAGRWVPYPFQNNLRHLPPDIAYECVVGLIEAVGAGGPDFASWMTAVFGEGVTRHFMMPYNEKVWATPLERMSSSWLAERVSIPDPRRVLRNMICGVDDVGWGPNNRFAFPAQGGTGEIYRRLAASLGASRVVFEAEVVEIDAAERVVRAADGRVESYDVLVSTMPLDCLVDVITSSPHSVRRAAAGLEHNDVFVVGVGYDAPLRDDRSWLYFPDHDVPFYRATNFAKYAPSNVPGGDTARYSSYMTEVAHSRWRPRSAAGIEDDVDGALRRQGLVDPQATVASTHVIPVERAYPVPTLGRDAALMTIQGWLMDNGIFARGRMGSWRYEIGNMDHAVKMGIDVARHVVTGAAEELWS